MPTRKAFASDTSSTATGSKTRKKARSGRSVRSVTDTPAETLGGRGRRSSNGVDFAKFLAPGAAVVASGALAAVGYAFKDQLGEIVVQALTAGAKQGRKAAKIVDSTRDQAIDLRDQAFDLAERVSDRVSDKVSLESLLSLAGLQRKSTMSSILGPAIGVACGIVAGSALTYFFGPKLLEQLKDAAPAPTASMDPAGSEHSDDLEPSVTTETADRVRANGGMHGGVS